MSGTRFLTGRVLTRPLRRDPSSRSGRLRPGTAGRCDPDPQFPVPRRQRLRQ